MNSRWLFCQVWGEMPKRKAPKRRAGGRGPARSWKFKAWIRTLACACCGSTYRVEAAHTGSDGGAKQRASDFSCIPLCWECHTAAAHSHHRNRAACEQRILEHTGYTVPELVVELNREWKLARDQAA